MEGVTRWFTPWPDAETFPVRMLDKANENSSRILKATLRTLTIGSVAAFSAWAAVAVSAFTIVPVVTALLAAPVFLYYKRMLAWRFMQKAWQSAYTDKRRAMFPTMFLGEKWAARSATLGRLGAKAALIGGAVAAFTLFATNPVVAVLAGLTSLSSLSILKATNAYDNDNAGAEDRCKTACARGYTETTKASEVPGATALESATGS
jgi:hypothetical protein